MNKILNCQFSLMLYLLSWQAGELYAQKELSHDSSYFETYPGHLTSRVFYSRKFTGFNVAHKTFDDLVFKYRPNTTRNLGIGATYDWFTLNLAYGFDFLNQDKERGETNYLDLQSHVYLGKFNIDLLGQFYEGYYLANGESPTGEIYVRPDIQVTELGVSVQYVVNHRKFSFKAAFQNTEYQKKSAGSWILGGNVFYGSVQADSSLIPSYHDLESPDYNRLRFFKIGPVGGYAYTLVLLKKLYLTGSGFLALNSGVYRLKTDDVTSDEFFVSLDYGLRLAVGYNSPRFNMGGLYVLQRAQADSNYKNIISTGNLRFIFSYRFSYPRPETKK